MTKFEVSQESADKLAALWNEMENVKKKKLKFNQNDCLYCVIGSGIRAGIMNGFSFGDGIFGYEYAYVFDDAVGWVGLEFFGSDYLFGCDENVSDAAERLGLPVVDFTPTGAQKRIQYYLNEAGYDLI